MDKLPRGIRTGKLEKKWKAQEIDTQWKKTSTYRARERREKRKNMTDFDRFVCMKLKKQVRSPTPQHTAITSVNYDMGKLGTG